MQGTWEFIPGSIAALLYVRTPETTGESQAVVYLSKEKGAVTGRRDTPLAESGWPLEVQQSINDYFKHVFSLIHEERTSAREPSPRAVFVDNVQPWTITIN
jgi:hypothetical protein